MDEIEEANRILDMGEEFDPYLENIKTTLVGQGIASARDDFDVMLDKAFKRVRDLIDLNISLDRLNQAYRYLTGKDNRDYLKISLNSFFGGPGLPADLL